MEKLELRETLLETEEFRNLYDQWKDDIHQFMPDFDLDDAYFSKTYLLLYEKQPAGFFIYQEKGDEIHILMDFLAEEYRNKGIGKKVFEDIMTEFKSQGFKLIVGLAYNPDHVNYLKHLGFKGSKKYKARFEISLK